MRLTLYKNAHCPLCDELQRQLAHLQAEFRHEVEVIDTEQETNLEAFYRENVPVLAIAGQVRLWGRITPGLLRRELRAAQRTASTNR